MQTDARTVVVTGAARGLGEAVARAFAKNGDRVAVADIDGARAEACATALRAEFGVDALGAAADVSRESDVVALADEVVARLGNIDVWINNAGVTRTGLLQDLSIEDFDVVMNVHARGTFLGIREATRRMLAAEGGGVILNVTSSAGLQGTIGQINYSGAKGAITSMTKSAAMELARHGIRVNAIAPLAATPMTEKIRTNQKLSERFLAQIPLRRIAEPNEVVSAFLYLASDGASYVTGQVLCIDGGLYMAS